MLKRFIKNRNNHLLILVSIILLAFAFRIAWLDRIPVGLSNDELDYALSAKFVFLTGSDISGTWNPLSLKPIPSSFPQAELPALLLSPFIGPFDLNLFNARLPYALIGIGTVVLIYLIGKKLFGNYEALCIGIIAAINPWSIFFSRTLYDIHLALFFYVLALYLIISLRGWKLLLAFIPLFLGFYSYVGFKLLFLPYATILILYSWITTNKKRSTKQLLILSLLCIMLFSYYVSAGLNQPNTRLGELFTPNSSSIAQMVNKQRQLSTISIVTPIVNNKYTLFAKTSLEKYYGAFSPYFLFLNGDNKGEFSLREHGVFYYIDALFLIIGFLALFRYKKSVVFLIAALILISPIPSVASTIGVSYAVRSILLSPVFIILIGLGIFTLIQESKKYINYKIMILLLLAIYGVLILNFLDIYLLRNPIYNSEASNLSGRILSSYIDRTANGVVIITPEHKTSFKSYLFTTNSLTKSRAHKIKTVFNSGHLQIDSLRIMSCEDYKDDLNSDTVILESNTNCIFINDTSKTTHIAQLKDGGSIYKIINDKLCSNYKLSRYPQNIKLSDFAMEELSNEQFCKTFIIKY